MIAARRRDALGVLAVALLVRLAVVAWAHGRFPAAEDGHYYDVLARRLASGAGYTWPWPDGTVTYAALYPVGYPAMLALAYAAFGASVGVAMGLNALLGAVGAWAAYRLADDSAGLRGEHSSPRWRPLTAGLVVALHPALVPYTAAVMTEGVTASLLLLATAIAATVRTSGRPWRWTVGLAVVLGIATLVRPQSLLLAPLLGALAVPVGGRTPKSHTVGGLARERLLRALTATTIALLCVAPWTVRNCERIHRCALVSVNGGWNLLIGAQTTSGVWEPLVVPPECATVWDEGGKDACFERAARRDITASPAAWLGRVPAKIETTLDYFGAGPWYLHAANPDAFGDQAKLSLGVVETIACRLLLLGALAAVGRWPGARRPARSTVALLGGLAAVTTHGWIGYLALIVAVALLGRRAIANAPVIVPVSAGVIAATVLVHAVFFGAGRYGLVVAPFVAVLAFVGRESSRRETCQKRLLRQVAVSVERHVSSL